jgi:hypothetical protein
MTTKTTLSHRTETGNIETRKTAREYGYVVVVARSADEVETAIADHRGLIETTEGLIAYIEEHWDERRLSSCGTTMLVVSPTSADSEVYESYIPADEKAIKRLRRKIAKQEGFIADLQDGVSTATVLSWHGTRANAEKGLSEYVAMKFAERGNRVYVEAINGGER